MSRLRAPRAGAASAADLARARAAATQLGPQAATRAVWLHTGLGLPLGKVCRVFRTQWGMPVTRGPGPTLRSRRQARHADVRRVVYGVRGSPVVTPDETGWKVGGVLHWLWAAATPTTTVYRIAAGRGFDDAAALLGADFAGGLDRDCWAPYRRFTQATHHTCLAHSCVGVGSCTSIIRAVHVPGRSSATCSRRSRCAIASPPAW